jgi:MSHA biogenesis protein MshN
MSLVNDMLRDLDQRRAGEATTASGESLKPAQPSTAESKSRLVFIIGGLATSAAIFSGIWFFGLGTKTSEVDIAISTEVAVSSPALVNKSVSVAGAVESNLDEVRTISDSSNVSTVNEMQLTAQEILSEPSVLEMPSEPLISDLGESEIDLGEAGIDAPARAEEKAQENAIAINTTVQPATLLDAPQTIRSIDELSANEVDVIQVQSALTLLANGNEEAAFDALSSHVRAAPAAHQSRETLIKLLLSRGQTARAGALADAGLSIAPNHSGFKKAKARVLIVNKNYESAAALLSVRAPKPSSDLEYHELLASAQLGAGDFVGAMQSYRQLIQFDGSQARWWYGYAVANDRMGNVSAAKQSYEQALKGASLSVSLRRSSEERVAALAAQ